jgi:tripartite-type tricarboxylate transporter receptor subunit TctC
MCPTFARAAALAAGLTAATALLPATAADPYPSKPIEFVVPASAGGGTDVMARAFTEAARKYVTQPLVVNDRPGASGGVGMGEVQRAAPDGYKVGVLIAELAIIPHLGMIKFGVDDFIPIARLNADPASLTVRAESPWQTIDDFLAHVKKNPGTVKVGNSGNGSIWHLAAAAVEDKTGVRFNHIPFQGAAPGVLALMGGHVDAMATSPGEVATYVASGKLRTLVVLADQRQPGLFAGVPTAKEKGIDLSIGTWRGLGVPLNTPPEAVAFLRETTRKAVDDPVFKDAMAKANLTVAYQDGESFGRFMKASSGTFRQLVGKINVKE